MENEKIIIYPENTLIKELESEFSVRTFNCLLRLWRFAEDYDKKTIQSLCEMTSQEILEKRDIGFKTLMEIRNFLRKQNRSLKDDILVSKEEEIKLILSIPETLKTMEAGIRDMNRKLNALEHDLHSIRASCDPRHRKDMQD